MSNRMEGYDPMEDKLKSFYQSAEPAPEFLQALEMQLIEESRIRNEEKSIVNVIGSIFKIRQVRLVFAPALIALALVVLVSVMGPGAVLAQVQDWLGYVPGYGFGNLNAARILAEPVSQSRDGVVVVVKQVFANREGTYVILGVEGGPSEDEILNFMQPPSSDENYDTWLENYNTWLKDSNALYESSVRLLAEDGTILDDYYFQGAYWDGFLTFEALPEEVDGLALEIDRLPGVPEGWAPQGWHFDLKLTAVSKAQLAEMLQAVPVHQVSNSVLDIEAEVLDVVYAPTEVSIRVQIQNLPEGWGSVFDTLDAYLVDDQGAKYPILYGPNSGRGEDGIYTVTFRPVSSDASSLTLTIVNLELSLPIGQNAVRVDFGSALQVGDQISLDTGFDVLGMPVHFSGLSFERGETIHDAGSAGEQVAMNTFDFIVDPIPVREEARVTGLEFSEEVFAMFGVGFGSAGQGWTGSGGQGWIGSEPGSGYTNLLLTLSIPAEGSVLSGIYELPLVRAQVRLDKPLSITWNLDK